MELRLDPFAPSGVSIAPPEPEITVSSPGTESSSTDSASIVTEDTIITATSGHIVVDVDATAGDITISLPTAVGNRAIYSVRKSDDSANLVIIDPTETINGESTLSIQFQNSAARIQSNGVGMIVT